VKNAANKRGGDRNWQGCNWRKKKMIEGWFEIWRVLAPHLNETARFLQNDAVSYIQEKKKKKEQNGVVLNDTVHLLPPITQRGRRKNGCFNLNFCRPLSRLEPTDRTQWPTTHHAPARKPVRGAEPWQSHPMADRPAAPHAPQRKATHLAL